MPLTLEVKCVRYYHYPEVKIRMWARLINIEQARTEYERVATVDSKEVPNSFKHSKRVENFTVN